MCCSRKFRALMGAFLIAVLAFTPLINVVPSAFAEGDVEAETQDVEPQEANDVESEPQADDAVTYGGEQLSDWTYTDNGDNSITLTAYNATATDIIIPGDFGDGKTVKINSFDMLKNKGMTTLQVKASDAGNKVVYDGTSMASAFADDETLTSVDVSGLDTSKVTNMASAFYNKNLQNIESLSDIDVSNVTDFGLMFNACNSIESIDLSGWNTSKATNMQWMFNDCKKLKEIKFGQGFNTSNVTNFNLMFSSCSSLTNIDVSNFNTEKATTMRLMFSYCDSLTNIDVSNFDTSNVTDMSSMFYATNSQYLDLSSFTIKDGTVLTDMFNIAPNANKLATAIIATDSKLKALEVDGKLGNGRIPYQSTITFNENEVSTQANEDSTNVKTIKADKIFYDSVAEFQEAQKAFTLTKEQVLADIAEPTKAGFTFDGWFTDAAATAPLGDTLTLAGTGDNVTLYAGWTAIGPEPTPSPAPGPETGDVDNPGSDVSGDAFDSNEQAADKASVSTVTPVTGDNVAVVIGIALSMLILALSTVVFARKRRQQ